MRARALRRLTAVALAMAMAMIIARPALSRPAGPTPQTDGAPELELRLEVPDKLVVGDRARIVARVRVTPPSDLPVLLTPVAEGTAIEVVRGRMFRSDAKEPDGEELRFDVPIVARTSGTSVLRVRVLAYVCERRCKDVWAEAALPLRVERPE